MQFSRDTTRFLACFLFLLLCWFPSARTATTAEVSSYGVSVTAELAGCEFASSCWHINIAVAGSPSGHLVLYLHTQDSQIAFPCSFGDQSRCECLSDIVSAYTLTSISDVNASCATSTASPAITSALFGGDAAAVDDVSVQVTENGYTIVISDAALDSLGAITSGSGQDVTAELSIGFAELMPVASLDYYDPVAHEVKLTLQKSFFATFSSASSQASSSLSYFAARMHRVTTDSNGEKFYAAATFVLGSSGGRRGSITGIDVPVSSIVVTDASGAEIAVDCDSESGDFTGTTEDFTASCGPFPDEPSVPFCSGQLHTYGEANGLASIFIPLASAPTGGVVTVQFVALANGTGAPVLETLQIGINVDIGVVQWCAPAQPQQKLATVKLQLPLSREEFDRVQQIYREAIATALGLPIERVEFTRIQRATLRRTVRRSLLAEAVIFEAEITIEPEEAEVVDLVGNVTTLANQQLNVSDATPPLEEVEEPTIIELESFASVDLIQETDLDVRMYAGVMLEDEAGFPASLTLLDVGASTFPSPKATLMDGVITVAASYKETPNVDPTDNIADNTTFQVELFRLIAVHLSDPESNGDVSSRIEMPVPTYSPATGDIVLDTASVCIGNPAATDCEVKTLVERSVLQGDADDEDGATSAALAVHGATDSAAGEWLQSVAGTDNPFIAAQGSHFRSQVAAAWDDPERGYEAYWINPRRESALPVGAGISSAVVVIAVYAVRIQDPSQDARRAGPHWHPGRSLLQAVNLNLNPGRDSDRAVSSGEVRLEVTGASALASAHGVREELVTSWILHMGLSLTDACGPAARTRNDPALMAAVRSRLLLALVGAASPVLDVQVTSAFPDLHGVDCPALVPQGSGTVTRTVTSGQAEADARGGRPAGAQQRQRRLMAQDAAEPRVLVEAMIVFAEPAQGSRVWLDVDQLTASPHGIEAAVLMREFDSPVTVIEKLSRDDEDTDGTPAAVSEPESDPQASNSTLLLAISILAVAGAVIAVVVVMVLVSHRRRTAAMQAAPNHPTLLTCAPTDGKLAELVALPSVPGTPFSMDRSQRPTSSPLSATFDRFQRAASSFGASFHRNPPGPSRPVSVDSSLPSGGDCPPSSPLPETSPAVEALQPSH